MSLDVTLIKILTCECGREHATGSEEAYSANITHNLGPMARACDLYEVMWRPDELVLKTAKELIGPLTAGLKKLKKLSRQEISDLTPSNGWGSYDQLIGFTENYLDACNAYPNAIVEVSR